MSMYNAAFMYIFVSVSAWSILGLKLFIFMQFQALFFTQTTDCTSSTGLPLYQPSSQNTSYSSAHFQTSQNQQPVRKPKMRVFKSVTKLILKISKGNLANVGVKDWMEVLADKVHKQGEHNPKNCYISHNHPYISQWTIVPLVCHCYFCKDA